MKHSRIGTWCGGSAVTASTNNPWSLSGHERSANNQESYRCAIIVVSIFYRSLVDDVLGEGACDKVPMEKVVMLIWQFRDDPSVITFMARFMGKVGQVALLWASSPPHIALAMVWSNPCDVDSISRSTQESVTSWMALNFTCHSSRT
jgi:hypothetical protein